MAKIRPLINALVRVIHSEIEAEGVTRQDATDAFAIAMTKIDQAKAWPL